jgi:hypothetical protein
MYTFDQLAVIVKEHGDPDSLSTVKRRIEAWHQRDGLLPEPTRPPIPGKRGRGPLVFPELAARAVLSLNRWRHRVSGVESARGYLWLEGFDYLAIEPEAELQRAHAQIWDELRSLLPSLPPAPDTAIDGKRREDILDELDTNVTAPAAAHFGLSEAVFATLPGILGLYNPNELEDLDKNLVINSYDTTVQPLFTSMIEFIKAQFGPILRPDDEATVRNADGPVYDTLANLGIAKWLSTSIDLVFVRAVWQFICLATDIPDSFLDDRIRLFTLFLRQFRDTSYDRRSPWVVAQIVAVLGAMLTPEQRSSFVHYVQEQKATLHPS